MMSDILVPDVEEIRTTIGNSRNDKQMHNGEKAVLNIIQEGGHSVTDDDHSDNGEPFVPFDVILIHGVYGTSPDSWTRESNTIWINKALVNVAEERGRIMSYGYHTDVEKGRYYSPCGIYQEARALLEALREFRTTEITEARRPIYFFSHDVGGAIVKAVLAIATEHEDKYADILHSTRAMYFFGYPHRHRSIDLLMEALLRLLALQHGLWSGHMVWYAKTLTETIVKVNDAFLATRMLTQAKLINVVSNLHLDPSKQVFPVSMSTMATPFELVVEMEKPNCDLILAEEHGAHPVNNVADQDWLMSNLTDEQSADFRKIINLASPVLPYHKIDQGWQHPDLLDLLKRKQTLIIHMRCPSDAEAVSENASFFLRKTKSDKVHRILYMKFNAHDIRFNNCGAMLWTFIARITASRLQTESDAVSSMDTVTSSEGFNEWETLHISQGSRSAIYVLGCFDECDESAISFLRKMHKVLLRSEVCYKFLIITTKGTHGDNNIASILSEMPSEHIRTIDHGPKEPIPFPVNKEAPTLFEKLGDHFGTNLHQDILHMLSGCVNDYHLCELVLEWLGSNTWQMARIGRLLNKPLNSAVVFAEMLGAITDNLRPWANFLLSWLLACYRPLRYDEFYRISDIVWLQLTRDKTTRPVSAKVLHVFHGLITSANGEIQFRHPATRVWLESHHSAGNGEAWYEITKTARHEMVLKTCMFYIQDAAGNPEVTSQPIPYVIEYWSKHWQLVEVSETQVIDLFENKPVFEFWVKSILGLPSTHFKPPLMHTEPLAVAAYLGMTAVVGVLLERNQYGDDLRGQALIEACRAGHAASIRLLIRSYPGGLRFGDKILHEAIRLVGNSRNEEAFRELVNVLPETSRLDLSQRDMSERSQHDLDIAESQETSDPQNVPGGAETGQDEVESLQPEEPVSEPLDWLMMPMHSAVKSGMDDIVTKLLQLGVKPNPPRGLTPRDNSFIYTAVSHSQISCVKILIEAGAKLTQRNEDGHTPLHAAASWASGEIIEFLLKHGASIEDEHPENHFTPLNEAAWWGSFTALKIMLSRKGEVECLVHDPDRHPVNQAVEQENNKCLKILLDHDFSPNIVTSAGETALRIAIGKGRTDLCKMLLDYNADPDLTSEDLNTPLILAISMGDLEMVKLLIEHGASIDKRELPPDEGWSRTPLQIAADWNKPEIFQYLVEKGADVNARDSDDIPVLCVAVSSGDTSMVEWLVDANAEVNLTYLESNSTPLHEATDYPEIVRLLLQHGADLSKVNAYSRTALNTAICENNLATVQILLEETKTKSDLDTANIEPYLRTAVVFGYTDVVEALLEAGADVNAVDEDKTSLLACAITKSAPIDMIRKILEYNPDLQLHDNKENTVLHCINTATSLETVRLVVNAGGRLNVLNLENETPLIYAIRARLDDVFSYMLKKEPTLLNESVALLEQRPTILHEACMAGTLAMVRSLVEHQMVVNSSCKEVYGTPLISATLRSDVTSSSLAREITALLLVNGADVKVSAGLFRYPLISACLACPPDIIKLLLNSNASPLDQDSLSRKPVHLSCYNSLKVLDLLEVPDSEFSARDVVGRVPLHYAVMRGDVELVQAVLQRSGRVGVDINVKDDDGWTPLLWAARVTPIWHHQLPKHSSTAEVVSFLLKNGANINAKGHVNGKDWTFHDVVYYHQADRTNILLDQSYAASEENTPTRKRGHLPDSQGDESFSCDCCLLENHGIYYKCSACRDFTLCYKCHWSASKIHSDHSSFIQQGSEWYEDSTSEQEKISEIGIGGNGGDEDVSLDREEILYEDYDSEMSDETP